MLCPKCRREGINGEMEIRGTAWYCNRHKLAVDFPIVPPTYNELERQNKELTYQVNEQDKYIAHLEELLDYKFPLDR